MTMRSRQHTSGDELEGPDLELESAGLADEAQDEVEEMEAAAQLLEITDEAELDQFIGGLLQKAARTAGAAIPGAVHRPLTQSLKGLLKKVLPIVADARRALRAPSSSSVSGAAANAFGLELEGMSLEDQEFELARRFVRLTRGAGKRAPRFARRVRPRVAVRRSLITAARRFAPGLLRRRRRHRHRYLVRRGRRIGLPAPIVYTEPEPTLVDEPVATTEPDATPDQTMEPDQVAGTEPDADPGAGAGGDAATNDSAPEPATDSEVTAGSRCPCCGGRCGKGRSRASGTWVREGAQIILQDI
jgi:hypothetical protein